MPSTTMNVASVVSRNPSAITYPLGKDRQSFTGATVTPFQWTVYDLVKQIPAGSISTYGAIAKHLGTSPRAVGNALRNNPFCPLVPCHRVVASSGQLGGFFGETGEGSVVDTKARMLADEGITLNDSPKGGHMILQKELQDKLWVGA